MSLSSTSAVPRPARLAVERLEDRTTPTFLTRPGGQVLLNNISQPTGGLSIASGDLYPDNALNLVGRVENEFVMGFGPGPVSQVFIYGRTGNLRNTFTPFPGFRGGINVAVGDVLGDNQMEIVVAAASGPPLVGVFNPQGEALSVFFAFSPFYNGGVNVAVGNVADGILGGGFAGGTVSGFFKQEIILGTASQSSFVRVTDGFGNAKREFLAFGPAYTGGVTLAAGSVDKQRPFGYIPNLGQVDTNAYDEIIVGAASIAPIVQVYSVWEGGVNLEQTFNAFPGAVGFGITVAAGSTDGLRGAEIYATLIGTSVVRTFDGVTQENLGQVQVYPALFSRVVNLTVANFNFIAGYDPRDDDTIPGGNNGDFRTLDLAVVAGDGPFFQFPRFFRGQFLSPAPFNGP